MSLRDSTMTYLLTNANKREHIGTIFGPPKGPDVCNRARDDIDSELVLNAPLAYSRHIRTQKHPHRSKSFDQGHKKSAPRWAAPWLELSNSPPFLQPFHALSENIWEILTAINLKLDP